MAPPPPKKKDDPNYHSERDTVANLGLSAFVRNTKAAAHAIATYAVSTDGLKSKRDVKPDSHRRRRGIFARDGTSSFVRRAPGKKTPAVR